MALHGKRLQSSQERTRKTTEYENVRDALKELVRLNEPGTTYSKVSTIIDSGIKKDERDFTIRDLQDSNYELLANVCDLLGMSEVYLEDDNDWY